MSPGAMQGVAAKPRQSRKAATVCGWCLCRRLPGLFKILHFYFSTSVLLPHTKVCKNIFQNVIACNFACDFPKCVERVFQVLNYCVK